MDRKIASRALSMILPFVAPALVHAQDVDIQCWVKRTGSGTTIDITQQFKRTPAYEYECNQPMPYYVPVDRWLCITDREGAFYLGNRSVGGVTAYANLMHDEPGHTGYHSLPVPPNTSMRTPMAFPPGGKTLVRVAIANVDTWGRFHWSGYLGRDASASREEACQ